MTFESTFLSFFFYFLNEKWPVTKHQYHTEVVCFYCVWKLDCGYETKDMMQQQIKAGQAYIQGFYYIMSLSENCSTYLVEVEVYSV